MKDLGKSAFSVVGIAAALFVFMVDVEANVDRVREGPNGLEEAQKIALDALEPSFLDKIINIMKCIDEKSEPIDLCNFKTSFDPLYYLQECAKNTTIQPLVEKYIQGIPVLKLPFGIPEEVSKERCFSQPDTLFFK